MNALPKPSTGGTKRAHRSDEDSPSHYPTQPDDGSISPSNLSTGNAAFRNVSACDRCRQRKSKCDQRLPACSACSKAGARCVGIDPITKEAIPRSYLFFLERRLAYFESLLLANNVPFEPPDAFEAEAKTVERGVVQSPGTAPTTSHNAMWGKKQEDAQHINQLVSNIDMVSVQGASDPQHPGSTSGISFAKVVFAAVKSSVSSNQNSERDGVRPSNVTSSGGPSMRDSCFGLQGKPTVRQATFPDRPLGEKLVNLYFEHANPQIPILHRLEFLDLLERAYSFETPQRTPRELYTLNIVFAIGAGIIFDSSNLDTTSTQDAQTGRETPSSKRARLSSLQHQPEEYHAAAIVHLESFTGSATDGPDGLGGGLEELQAVLLLAGFALLKPAAPGLWYIVGVAVRLAIDLGLHFEDGTGIESSGGAAPSSGEGGAIDAEPQNPQPPDFIDARERGRREWVRDLRRRLWWCVYSFDRLVSTCVGRPFGITDQVITTEFPSLLDDQYISRSGFLRPQHQHSPSYKNVAHHYFRLRLLQSEILQVLQHQHAQMARQSGTDSNKFMHTKLPSPFLANFSSFRSWRKDIDRRLWEWKESSPSPREIGVQFSVDFFALNYWQAVILLYRQSLTVPAPLAAMSLSEEVSSPSMASTEEHEGEDDVFLKVAEAGQRVLRLYRQFHRIRLVNYTYLATHHLFVAGISFLYAIWHSPLVRSRLTLDDVDFTILAATSVLGDLLKKCPPAEACKDAFERMSKVTVRMCMSTTGFGSEVKDGREDPRSPHGMPIKPRRPPPKFDMNLRDLFPDDIDQNDRVSQPYTPQRQLQFSPLYDESVTDQSQWPARQYPVPQEQPSLDNSVGPGLDADQPSPFPPQVQQAQHRQHQQILPQVFQPTRRDLSVASPFLATSPYVADLSSVPGFDFLQSTDHNEKLDISGIDLGFGPGVDFQHDWSDGTGVDIFDGFFFGNTASS